MSTKKKSSSLVGIDFCEKMCYTKPSLTTKQGFGGSMFTRPFFFAPKMTMNSIEQVVEGGSAMRLRRRYPTLCQYIC